MTDDYPWLDLDRQTHIAIYTWRPHSLCICIWETDLNGPSSGTDPAPTPALKLIARKKGCPIHGAKGWL